VVGYDGSEPSERALGRAAELAERLSARLVVVSVERTSSLPVAEPLVEPEKVFVASPVGGGMPVRQPLPQPGPERPSPSELARQLLEQARMTLARRGIEADYVSEVGAAADRLIEVAEERDADLLVVGSREHSLLERLVAGPVDEAVAQHASKDVLLVH
jgi:nucleotide-binding universal stress UspA family protein